MFDTKILDLERFWSKVWAKRRNCRFCSQNCHSSEHNEAHGHQDEKQLDFLHDEISTDDPQFKWLLQNDLPLPAPRLGKRRQDDENIYRSLFMRSQ